MLGQQQKPKWGYGGYGPGGGSLPYNIMSTGAVAPFDPMGVRHDIKANYVQDMVRIPVGMAPGGIPSGNAFTPNVPAASVPTAGVLLGQAPDGRPVRQFNIDGNPNTVQAQAVAAGARQVAQNMRAMGLTNLPSALVGGPLASLARGEAVILRWPNGIQVGASL